MGDAPCADVALLPKPFTAERLLGSVRDLLDGVITRVDPG